MMLKKKSNNWARLKLALLVPVGFAALKCIRPSGNKSAAGSDNDRQHSSID